MAPARALRHKETPSRHTRRCYQSASSQNAAPAHERTVRPLQTTPVALEAPQITSKQHGETTSARPALRTAAAGRSTWHTGARAFKRRYQTPRGPCPISKLATCAALRGARSRRNLRAGTRGGLSAASRQPETDLRAQAAPRDAHGAWATERTCREHRASFSWPLAPSRQLPAPRAPLH